MTTLAATPNPPSPFAERVAKTTILIYALGTFIALFSWLFSPLHPHASTRWWETFFGLINVPVTHSLLSAVVMGLITTALIRRKRAGLVAVFFFQIFGVFLGITSARDLATESIPQRFFFEFSSRNPLIDVAAMVFSVIACVLLWRARRAFPAKVYRGSWLLALLVLLVGTALTAAVLWFTAGAHDFNLGRLALYAIGLDDGSFITDRHKAGWILQLGFTLLALTLIATVLTFLRSPTGTKDINSWTPERESKLRSLLHDFGANDSLSYFATRREKSLIFSTDEQAAIAYRVINSVCLASGDPVGNPSSWGDAIERWKAHARAYGWVPAAISVSEDGAKAFAAAGLSVVVMGDEAVLYPDRFSLNNTSLHEVRHAVARVRKGGYTAQISYHQDLSEEGLNQVIKNTDAWRHGETERGFSMALSRLGDPADARNLLVTAVDAQGQMVGLLSFVPWGKTGVSLDVMRRSPDAPNGVVEFMVAELMAAAEGLGITRVSLNFAMFRGVFENADRFGASPLTRLASSTLGALDRFLQLERLYKFNQKFNPDWLPRYLCTDSAVSFGQVAAAAGVAEGFLPGWLLRKENGDRTLDAEQLAQVREIERRRVVADDIEPQWSDQTRHRIRHLNQLRDAGHDPYPLGVRARHGAKALAQMLSERLAGQGLDAGAPGSEQSGSAAQQLSVSARVRSIRVHGGVTFVTLIEQGVTAQVVCEREALGATDYDLLTANLDTGDIAVFRGVLGLSRNGTASLLVSSWQMGSKSLHPIPFDGFSDAEARLRRRSTDLLVNPQQIENLKVRSTTITSIRKTLDADGFTEVETPILNTIHGGATARPFKTFINAYGADLTLRIAPELYLKRLVVGGMGSVYELGRDFRNEGADATHNPEFTVLEAYKPYADYTAMRLLTEVLIKNAAYAVYGDEVLPVGPKNSTERVMTDVSGPWPVRSVLEALSEAAGQTISMDTDFEVLMNLARENEIHVRDDMGTGAVIEELYGELVEANTTFPTFYTDFPVETSPLAGPHRSKPGLVERWDLVVNGMELGTAYSEMADALEQRRRLTEQSLKAAAGDLEAMQVDEDFLYALETGLPPTGGLGIGIDRLIMLLTQTQIRGVLAFPFVKPESKS